MALRHVYSVWSSRSAAIFATTSLSWRASDNIALWSSTGASESRTRATATRTKICLSKISCNVIMQFSLIVALHAFLKNEQMGRILLTYYFNQVRQDFNATAFCWRCFDKRKKDKFMESQRFENVELNLHYLSLFIWLSVSLCSFSLTMSLSLNLMSTLTHSLSSSLLFFSSSSSVSLSMLHS